MAVKKKDPKSCGQKWTSKVAAKGGPKKWRSKVDPKSGDQKCRNFVRYFDGNFDRNFDHNFDLNFDCNFDRNFDRYLAHNSDCYFDKMVTTSFGGGGGKTSLGATIRICREI